jgi:hypothetical protein
VDEAGPLPAVSGPLPEIFTISHDRYVDASAYSQAYIVEGIGYEYDRLIVEKEEARKAKDEETMIRKEDEARFWSDVRAWVKSYGTARRMPDPIPAWLTKLSPAYNP